MVTVAETGGTFMLAVLATLMLAAAGWALITYLFTGSFGLAILVFIVLKLIGR
ncbi:MAG TPA: hypothetical protein VK797_12520 [Tepidisphaeraceae bacterium]|jgi:hypothetical protein|nr:hypothetical protein [Tepidisphaeraceae bacterium]